MYGNSYDKEDILLPLKLIACIFFVCVWMALGQSCSRSGQNMIYISDGVCYEQDTKIIYRESFTGRYSTNAVYVPYYDENGDMCKYNTETDEWIPIID